MRFGVCDSCWLIFKLLMSVIATISAISIFITFLYVFNNYNAAIWGFMSGVFSFCVFHLNYLYMKNKIDEWYDHKALDNLKVLALICSLCSVVAIGVYTSLVITRNQDIFVMYGFSYFPSAIFSALTFKWSLFMFMSARKYEKYVLLCSPQFVYSVDQY